jgi:hypothetical protein
MSHNDDQGSIQFSDSVFHRAFHAGTCAINHVAGHTDHKKITYSDIE